MCAATIRPQARRNPALPFGHKTSIRKRTGRSASPPSVGFGHASRGPPGRLVRGRVGPPCLALMFTSRWSPRSPVPGGWGIPPRGIRLGTSRPGDPGRHGGAASVHGLAGQPAAAAEAGRSTSSAPAPLLLLAAPAFALLARADPRRWRPGALRPRTHRSRRPQLPLPEVPHHGRRRPGAPRRSAGRDPQAGASGMRRTSCRTTRASPGSARAAQVSLDELPQIINVLRGEMSIVGPGPWWPTSWALRPGAAGYYLRRPGITGLWQVSGRSDTSCGTRVALDETYVRTWSGWF